MYGSVIWYCERVFKNQTVSAVFVVCVSVGGVSLFRIKRNYMVGTAQIYNRCLKFHVKGIKVDKEEQFIGQKIS